MSELLVYGAYGYTGDLIARLAVERGLRPILAGRSAQKLDPLARELGCEARTFPLDDPSALAAGLDGVAVVLHCAGPFSRTAAPMVEACLAAGVHYLDITGEVEVFEAIAARDAEAREAGVMLMPGAGFDVVPSDSLALHLKERLPTATHLDLAFAGLGGGVSHGTALTMAQNIHRGSAVRRDGKIVPIPAGSLTRAVDFGRGPKLAMAIPWGDIATAWRSTGIPNIAVYVPVDRGTLLGTRVAGRMGWLLKTRPVQGLLERIIDARVTGPTEEQRREGVSILWGRAWDEEGTRVEARLRTPEGYRLTALASVAIARKALDGEAPVGYQTPAMAYGSKFVVSLTGVELVDLP